MIRALGGDWPALTHETVDWESRLAPGLAPRTQLRNHRGPYRAAVAPDIAEQQVALPAAVLAAAEDASTEIARFDAEMGAEIAPFTSVLLRSESAASSQIENLTASARAIAEAEIDASGRRNAQQIVAAARALRTALELAGAIDLDAVLAMHRALMETTDPEIAGRWRTEPVWIGGSSLGPHQAQFVPPQHTRVVAGMQDLMAFIDRDDLGVLVLAAVAHAQFETIHPFPDGNGRVGRALVHAILRGKGLTRSAAVPVSAGLLTDTAAYFQALTIYREGDPAAIVDLLATSSFAALQNGRTLVEDLRRLRLDWHDRVRARRDSAAWRLVDTLFEHPVLDAAMAARSLGIPASNVYRYLSPLQEAGVVTESTDRRRNRIWRAPEVLDALDAFAARAGRRRLGP